MPAAQPKKKTPKTAKTPKKAETFATKKIRDFSISKKRSGRYLVTGKNGKVVNGLEKARILVEAKLVEAGFPKGKEEAAAPTA